MRSQISSGLSYIYNFPGLDPSLVLYYPLDTSANGSRVANYATGLPVYDASLVGSSTFTYTPGTFITSLGDLSLNNTMGSQLVANTAGNNYVVCNNTIVPNISGGFSISLWFACNGKLNTRGTLLSLPLNKTGNGFQIDVSGTNMIYSGWNLPVSLLPPVSTNLVAYFPLNNTTKESVSGLSVSAATSVTYNTVASKTGINCTSSSGYGTSGTLNTSTSIVNYNIPTLTLPFTTNGVSFSLWFYPTAISSSNQILFNLADNTYINNAIFLLHIKNITNNGSIDLTYANYNTGYHGASISTVATFTNNNWYHLVVTLSNSLTSVCYVNNTTYTPSRGIYVSGGSLNGFNISTNNRIAVGCNTNNAYNGAGYKPPSYNSFTGTIAKVAIYNTVLSAAQVSTLYNDDTITGPLDSLSSAAKTAMLYNGTRLSAGAFGVIKLYSGYTGPTIQIKAGTGGTPTDFYPVDALGNLITAGGQTLTSFLSGATAYVTKWYDQTGNDNHTTGVITGTNNPPTFADSNQNSANFPILDNTRKCLDFSQGNAAFKLANGAFPSGNSSYTYTYRIGTTYTAPTGGGSLIITFSCGTYNTANNTNLMILFNPVNNQVLDSWYSLNIYPANSSSAKCIYSHKYDASAPLRTVYYNKNSVGTRADGNHGQANTNNCIGYCTSDMLGQAHSYFNSQMPFFYWAPIALSDSDRNILENTTIFY